MALSRCIRNTIGNHRRVLIDIPSAHLSGVACKSIRGVSADRDVPHRLARSTSSRKLKQRKLSKVSSLDTTHVSRLIALRFFNSIVLNVHPIPDADPGF